MQLQCAGDAVYTRRRHFHLAASLLSHSHLPHCSHTYQRSHIQTYHDGPKTRQLNFWRLRVQNAWTNPRNFWNTLIPFCPQRIHYATFVKFKTQCVLKITHIGSVVLHSVVPLFVSHHVYTGNKQPVISNLWHIKYKRILEMRQYSHVINKNRNVISKWRLWLINV